jgi:hypothetical protein
MISASDNTHWFLLKQPTFQAKASAIHAISNAETGWIYGNIYDPKDGVTSLDWWR